MTHMHAMVLTTAGQELDYVERPLPQPGPGEIRVHVTACAVCRTDLHVVDGELPQARLPVIPGHEIIGRIDAIGSAISRFKPGMRVGIPWLGGTCGQCTWCREGRENLCDTPVFTGCTRDGGFATHVTANADYAFALPDGIDDVRAAPLMCAGLIGWRCLSRIPAGRVIGIYGFGAAAHIIAQVARHEGRTVHAFTRPGDTQAQDLARALGCAWAGNSTDEPPEPLDAAIIFAPVGSLVPQALRAVRKGGRVICGGIHMSDIPTFPYSLLWGERELVSVANLTRKDARDFLEVAGRLNLDIRTTTFRLLDANAALASLRSGNLSGAAVLLP